MTVLGTYTRLGSQGPPEDESNYLQYYHQVHHNHHQRPFQRTLFLVLLFLLSFIFIFIFTLLLSLLLGDVRHERTSDVIFTFESSVFEESELPSGDELSFYGQAAQVETPESTFWSAVEAHLPKVDRRQLNFKSLKPETPLLNLHNFTFLKTADRTLSKCRSMATRESSSPLHLVILVHSAVGHFAQRQALRRTWLSLKDSLTPPGSRIAHAFILGQTENNTEMRAAVEVESRLYGDLVVGNFLDSYRNLTVKHLAGLRWAVQFEHCASETVDYLLKVDDDAFVDMYAVLQYLTRRKAKDMTSPLICSLFEEGTAPKRTGKWALSRETYPFESFPAYCSGVGYFLQPKLAIELLAASEDHRVQQKLPVIPIDDVYVTGLLRSTLWPPVKAVSINRKYVYDVRKLRRWLKDEGDDCPSGYLIGDVGSELDATSLATKLWSKTERAWSRRFSEDNSFKCSKSTVKVTSL